MSLSIQSLSELTQDQYDAARELVLGWLQEAHPDFALVGGALDQLLLNPSAILEAANQANTDRIRQASSLKAIDDDPTLADDADEEVVDRLTSNYRITRLAAAVANGQATLVLSALVPVTIGAEVEFTDPAGTVFVTEQAFSGKISSADVIAETDRLISAVGDGTYAMTLDLAASATGVAGNIARLTALTTDAEITNLVRTYATADFTGGRADETNTALITRMRANWTARSPSTRAGLEGLLRSQEDFESIVAVSTIGYGDGEMRRNHSILPLSLPGRVDCYVRVQAPWESRALTVTATLVGTFMGGTRGVWQFVLSRNDGPIYKIDKITLPQDSGDPSAIGYTITLNTPGYDVTVAAAGAAAGLISIPDITSAAEAAFSRYQTATVQFQDPDTDIAGMTVGVTTKSYVVAFRSMPGIDTLQDAVAARSVRSTVGDCLVKAAVPCFVTLTVNIDHTIGADDVDEDAVKAAVAEAVNNTGFIGTLAFSTVTAAAQEAIPDGSRVTTVSGSGTIYRPSGSTTSVSGTSSLSIATDNTNQVSSRTTVFFASVDDVTVNVSDVAAPEA